MAGMIKRFVPLLTALMACLALAACSSFAGYVSDHWPTWAGGMPADVPPRPGAPGYSEFLIQQQGKEAPPPPAPADKTAAQAAPGAGPANDQPAMPGGLY